MMNDLHSETNTIASGDVSSSTQLLSSSSSISSDLLSPPLPRIVPNIPLKTAAILPPQTVVVYPEPAPYAQLCYDEEQDTLVSMMVKNSHLTLLCDCDESPELQLVSSHSSSSDCGLSTCSGSSAYSKDTYTYTYSVCNGNNGNHVTGPHNQEIIWVNREWFFDDRSYGDLGINCHLLGERDDASSEEGGETGTSTCAGFLRRSITCRRANQHDRNNNHKCDRLPYYRTRKPLFSQQRSLLGNQFSYEGLYT